MTNQISRAHRRFIAPSPQPLPDPLYGLSPYERRHILLLPPTWSERHRMCLPGRTREERLNTLLDIMFERRRAYDIEFHARCKRVELERAHNRYLYNEQHLTEFKPAISTALSAVYASRREQDEREQRIRHEYQRQRAERRSATANRKKLRPSRGLSR